jgi:hypothetical protein
LPGIVKFSPPQRPNADALMTGNQSRFDAANHDINRTFRPPL